MRNLITDVPGAKVGNAHDARAATGVTVAVFDYGLDAASGVSAVLYARGKGVTFGGIMLPVAVQAILFDLMNGGEKDWLTKPVEQRLPCWELGRDATLAVGEDFAVGTVGAGYGATTANLKGWLGLASQSTKSDFIVGALAVVNAVGMATVGDSKHFRAGPYEQGNELDGHGFSMKVSPEALP